MENILSNLIKDNLKKNEKNLCIVIDPLTLHLDNTFDYNIISKNHYFYPVNRIKELMQNTEKILLTVSYELQYINIDLVKNDKVYYTFELNFNNKDFVKNFIENVTKNSFKLDFKKVTQFIYFNENRKELNLLDLI